MNDKLFYSIIGALAILLMGIDVYYRGVDTDRCAASHGVLLQGRSNRNYCVPETLIINIEESK